MREIVFDTETTGLDAQQDRVIEFGGVELVNRFPTGRHFHVYLNPQGRTVHPDAFAVHGISDADLAGKPCFHDVVEDLFAFIDGAHLVAHNATFDIAFVNAEFARCGQSLVEPGRVVDTLALARRKHPMGPNSLDALCRRYGVDNSHRTRHGALLDAELLAEVYIELIGGKQAALSFDAIGDGGRTQVLVRSIGAVAVTPRPAALPSRLSESERAAHAALVAELGQNAIWNRMAPTGQAAGG